MAFFPSTASSRLRHRLSFRRRPVREVVSAFSDEPVILYLMFGHDYHELFRQLRSRPAAILVWFAWTFEGDSKAQKLARRVERHQRRHRGHRFIFACNTPSQQRSLSKAGLEAIFANHNALIDERVFRILPDVERRFDALYDAQIAPFKRHQLASELESLALIAYLSPGQYEEDYGRDVMRRLAHAHWFRNPMDPDDSGRLEPEDVARAINACRVGLCLSAEEGAMFASTQYLLCGVPVVSTHSRGGRDVFFDPKTSRLVDDDPTSVAKAVDELVSLDLDPRDVRGSVLTKVLEHRQRFIDLVAEIHREAGIAWSFPEDWDRFYFNKMVGRTDLRKIGDWLERGGRLVDRYS